MTDNSMYKISVYPFTKAEAKQISSYLTAFMKDKTTEVEKVNDESYENVQVDKEVNKET